MRIVHVVEPFASGVAVFVKQLVENLSHDLHIVIHGERKQIADAAEVKKTFPNGNVKFIKWRSAQRSISLLKDIVAFVELYKLLSRLKKSNNIDAVHLHSSKSGFLGRLACRLANINNVVYTPNGAPFLASNKRPLQFLYKIFEKVGSSFGGQVVCCSTSEKQLYEQLGIRAVTINNGISIDSVKPTAPFKKDERFTIVNCARITEQKNPELFNRIAKQFEDMNQFRFVWVGDGEDREKLSAKNIEITGWLTEAEAHQIVNAADVYLSTSHFEGLSFSVLEALAFKKPVLLKRCVGNKDVVKKGLNGDLFNHDDEAVVKILSYYNNKNMLPVMGEYSKEVCRREFNIDSTCLSYRNLYRGMVYQM